MTGSQTSAYPGAIGTASYAPGAPSRGEDQPIAPGTYPGASPYPPALQVQPEPATKQELIRQQLGGLALLFVLTSITLGVTTSSMTAFWTALKIFLVFYTLLAWGLWFLAWRR